MRVVRVLIYEQPDQATMDHQLGTSLPDGKKEWGARRSITVYTLPNRWRLVRLFWLFVRNVW